MEDNTPVDESSDEMVDSTKDNDDRDKSEKFSRNSTIESEKSFSAIQELLLRTVLNKTLTPTNVLQIKFSEALRQRNHNDLLLQRQRSYSTTSGTSRATERLEAEVDTPYLDAHEGQPSTSSYPPVVAEGLSAGDRFNSSTSVAASGEARERMIISEQMSKYPSNAQKLLLTILEEMMKFNKEEILYSEFRRKFLINSEDSFFVIDLGLMSQLIIYLSGRGDAYFAENEFPSLTAELYIQEAYEVLIRIVVTALISTMSMWTSCNFDSVMANYKALKDLYERCLQFWRDDNEEIQDEDCRNRVAFLKKMILRLLLQTRNAFRELLMHIGEYAESRIVNSYEEKLWGEDKSFLRRRIQ